MPVSHEQSRGSPKAPARPGAERFVSASGDLAVVRQAAAGCRGCELWKDATQTIFGEGSEHPQLVLVGEQPGDREDVEGHPFVGPAGHVLDVALERAGLERRTHLQDERGQALPLQAARQAPPARGPAAFAHVVACRPWLRAELEILSPPLLVLLGAVAAQSLLGPGLQGEHAARPRSRPARRSPRRDRDRPPLVDPARSRRAARRAHGRVRRPILEPRRRKVRLTAPAQPSLMRQYCRATTSWKGGPCRRKPPIHAAGSH